MTARQVEELRALEPWSREFGAAAFARRHGMTVRKVYHWRKKLSLPVAKWCGRTAAVALITMALLHNEALAAERSLSWSHPTQRLDGTPLAVTDIQQTEVRWGRCEQALYKPITVPAPATTLTIDFPLGIIWCVEIATLLRNGHASTWSDPVMVLMVVPAPQAPRAPAAPTSQ